MSLNIKIKSFLISSKFFWWNLSFIGWLSKIEIPSDWIFLISALSLIGAVISALGVSVLACSVSSFKHLIGPLGPLFYPTGTIYFLLAKSISVSTKYWIVFEKPCKPSVSKPTTIKIESLISNKISLNLLLEGGKSIKI